MRFVLMLIAAACAGALTVIAVPAPLRAIFDSGQRQLQPGTTSGQLGIPSAITLTPMPLAPPRSLKLDLGQAYQAQADSQIDPRIRHSQTMGAYTNNPSAWPGSPPK